jgi:hypothetical protein
MPRSPQVRCIDAQGDVLGEPFDAFPQAGYCGSSVTAAARVNEAHVPHGNAVLINSGDPD